jgi:hypothetical protein
MSDDVPRRTWGQAGIFRPSNWVVLLATAVMFLVVALGFIAYDLGPQAGVAMASSLLMGFVAGYCYRARVRERGTPSRLKSFWLEGDDPTVADEPGSASSDFTG